MSVNTDRRKVLQAGGACALWSAPQFSRAAAKAVQAAVAANFAATMRSIQPLFETASGHRLQLSFGATGKFYAQITQGAPFEVLLAADAATPARLMREGHAVPSTQNTYALGRLALYSAKSGFVDAAGQVLSQGQFKRLSIANPKLAPYGAAAIQTLQALKLWPALQPQIVQADSVAQVMQHVQSGNADLGFIAFSQLKTAAVSGSHWLVPERMHSPIQQDFVLLKPGAANPAARELLAYMQLPSTRALIQSHGYT
jgi:molybdate transport system substrate-binding protein